MEVIPSSEALANAVARHVAARAAEAVAATGRITPMVFACTAKPSLPVMSGSGFVCICICYSGVVRSSTMAPPPRRSVQLVASPPFGDPHTDPAD